MAFAYPMQKIQDWLTQQWVILRGQKINPEAYAWLIGPFGNLEAIGEDYIRQFALKEGLLMEKGGAPKGLIPEMSQLNLPDTEWIQLSREVIRFYEKTAEYNLDFAVHWNPFFKVCGILLNKLFSKRLNQLNVPTRNLKESEVLNSELITLSDPVSKAVKYTFWYRSIQSTGKVIYSGVYGTCTLPCGKTCVKAVFPLPNGNATVLMSPKVDKEGALILDSSGERFGDAGFYFLLKDAKGHYWSQFIRSFRDRLVVKPVEGHLSAEQTLTLWHKKVLRFNYNIKLKV